jgi:hypothetical protein
MKTAPPGRGRAEGKCRDPRTQRREGDQFRGVHAGVLVQREMESGRSPLVSKTRASGVQGRSGQGQQLVSNEVRLAGVLESCSLDGDSGEAGR